MPGFMKHSYVPQTTQTSAIVAHSTPHRRKLEQPHDDSDRTTPSLLIATST